MVEPLEAQSNRAPAGQSAPSEAFAKQTAASEKRSHSVKGSRDLSAQNADALNCRESFAQLLGCAVVGGTGFEPVTPAM